MKEQLMNFIKEQHLFKKPTTLLLGVSGGPDSMALLHLFHILATDYPIQLKVITVDHQLRGEASREDSLYVWRFCQSLGIDCACISVDVTSYKEKYGLGTQVACRDLRYQAFKEEMAKQAADYLVLGHHADDQIETMLMQFSKVATPEAMLGMPARRPFASGEIIRPLLGVTKDEIEAYVEREGIGYRMDPTNLESDYTRNEFRHHIIPILKKHNPNLHNTVQYLSKSLQNDEQFLQTEAKKMFETVVILDEKESVARFSVELFKSYSIPLQRRVFHLILNYLYNNQEVYVTYVHETDFFALFEAEKSNVSIDLPGQLQMLKVYDEIMFRFQSDDATTDKAYMPLPLNVPGEVTLKDGSTLISSWESSLTGREIDTYCIPVDQVSLPLYVRTPQDGERMTWRGLQGTKKLSRIFIDEKIPKYLRKDWPVVVDSRDRVVWLVGLKKSVYATDLTNTTCIYIHHKKIV